MYDHSLSSTLRIIRHSVSLQTVFMYFERLQKRTFLCDQPSCLDIGLGPVDEGLQLEQLDGQVDVVLQIVLRIEFEF